VAPATTLQQPADAVRRRAEFHLAHTGEADETHAPTLSRFDPEPYVEGDLREVSAEAKVVDPTDHEWDTRAALRADCVPQKTGSSNTLRPLSPSILLPHIRLWETHLCTE